MKRLLTIFVVVAAVLTAVAEPYTRYDWSNLALSVTRGKTTPREKAHAIYSWLAANIAYDTTYSIYHADEAYDARRGVCQAYCEMFYHMAKAVGLRTEIVSGISKDLDGKISDQGHAWIFAYLTDNAGIFIDPTWGAGSVNDGKFSRGNPNDETWFDVSPSWMIFSHFPEDERYQLLPTPLTRSQFASIPAYRPVLGEFGFDGKSLLQRHLGGERVSVPQVYFPELKGVKVHSVPRNGVLRIGEEYTFTVYHPSNSSVRVNSGMDFDYVESAGQGFTTLRYVPSEGSELQVCYKIPGTDRWRVLMQYDVAAATQSDIARLETTAPRKSPVLKRVANYNPKALVKHQVNLQRLIAMVKQQGIRQFPKIYDKVKFKINDIPWNGRLRVGQPVTFTISPYEGEWAVIDGDTWHRNWRQSAPGQPWTITVTPTHKGTLKISGTVSGDNRQFWSCIEYVVE